MVSPAIYKKVGRPSPRTGSTGVGIQKFGTQQLKFIDPAKPALGVREIIPKSVDPFGGLLKGVFGTETVRDTAYPELSISGTVDKEPLTPSFDLGDLFGGGNGKERCTLDDNKPFCAITQAIGDGIT